MKPLDWNTLRIYITVYSTYMLLYHKGHIHITSNYSIINMKRKKYINLISRHSGRATRIKSSSKMLEDHFDKKLGEYNIIVGKCDIM